MIFSPRLPVLACLFASVFIACSSSDDDGAGSNSDSSIVASSDGLVRATLRRTPGGVPHISGDDLASVAYGAGFAQAEDHVCLIAEAIVKARGERAAFFGPGENNINVITDFSYRALSVGDEAVARLTPESRALLDGFTAGYNRYVADTDASDLPPACRAQPWVRPISSSDLYAHYRVVAQFASGGQFAKGPLFAAVPPGISPDPTVVMNDDVANEAISISVDPAAIGSDSRLAAALPRNFVDIGLGSNAWGIGRTLTEGGRGALLANPHFPYTGPRRLYQMHLTVADDYNVNGAGLIGVALPLIGFNRNIAWSHTVSTARRFTLHELTLDTEDSTAYIKDGVTVPLTTETIRIEVATGTGDPVTLEREMYFSEYGPMVAAELITGGALPAWGANGTGYALGDANASPARLLDTWLGLGRASSLEEFQAVFDEDCGSTLWTNTVYSDDAGNAFYIDGSSVPHLSAESLAALETKRAASEDFASLYNRGLVLLEGNTSRDDWIEGDCNGRVPYAGRPKLLRDDFVQNSNSSYWQSNPAAPITGISPLFGREALPLNERTQLGLRMLQSPANTGFSATAAAGQDGRFNARELLDVIWNNRALYAELLLPELRTRCEAIGTAMVTLDGAESRVVDAGCTVLADWNGTYDIDSIGAHVFRVFLAQLFDREEAVFDINFDPADAESSTVTFLSEAGGASDPLLQSLASALNALDASGIAYNATLGSVQSWTPSGGVAPGGTPSALADSIPWHGGDGNLDGAFNAIGVVISPVLEDTLYPRVNPETRPSTGGLSIANGEGWAIARGTSWHFGLEFTDDGPEAYGLVSYSQSGNPESPYFVDQSLNYSAKQARRLLYNEVDIAANVLPGTTRMLEGALITDTE